MAVLRCSQPSAPTARGGGGHVNGWAVGATSSRRSPSSPRRSPRAARSTTSSSSPRDGASLRSQCYRQSQPCLAQLLAVRGASLEREGARTDSAMLRRAVDGSVAGGSIVRILCSASGVRRNMRGCQGQVVRDPVTRSSRSHQECPNRLPRWTGLATRSLSCRTSSAGSPTDARGLKARHCTFLAPDAVTDVLLQNDDVRVRVSGEEWQLLTSHVDLSPTFGPLVPCRGRLQRPG